ncbi:Uncharacterized protein CLAVI_000087 [Candidatus Clavichlamydia salmonicola]|uniref:lysophospholipid acyltransferase family protein n=1 Tax=Candidatus Clavichlamydia salmonicola TaxID=469812 RepID=UPI001891A993|nr:1-acyl-sn-glycerol-3-phosphate acyltransferase [Candidatus Clavichlamydia salmonicola]MBF5050482.1 Uncharacterized protein [Candidatus Clavichlamydia salmonicola]
MKYKFLYITLSFLLKLRYSVRLHGVSEILTKKKENPEGILFFANHVSLLDPMLFEIALWPICEPRPAASDYLFRIKYINFFLKKVRAISVPQYSSNPSLNKSLNINATFDEIHQGLQQGDNIIFWPAGRLTSTGIEKLGTASGASILLKKNPNNPILILCVVGLWGSSFSKYQTGKTPSLGKQLMNNFLKMLKRGIFFMPRRKIEIFCKDITKEIREKKDKKEINTFLEETYNEFF